MRNMIFEEKMNSSQENNKSKARDFCLISWFIFWLTLNMFTLGVFSAHVNVSVNEENIKRKRNWHLYFVSTIKLWHIVSPHDIIRMMYAFFCLDFASDINKSMKSNEYLYFQFLGAYKFLWFACKFWISKYLKSFCRRQSHVSVYISLIPW